MLLIPAAVALGVGMFSVAPASAAPLGLKAPLAVEAATTDAACRMVEKRVRRNGVTRITRTRECDDYGRSERRVYRERGYGDRGYSERRVYRSEDRRRYNDDPGISVRIGR